MGGSSRHVIPVYLDGATQTVVDADLDGSQVANWDGLTSRVAIDSSTNMTLKMGVPTHVGTVIFVEATNAAVGNYQVFDAGPNAGSETVVATLTETGDSVTVIWDNNRWRIISETDMASVTGSAPVDSVNGETGAVVLDTSDVDEAAAGPFYADRILPELVGASYALASEADKTLPRLFHRIGAADTSISFPSDAAYDVEIHNMNATGTVTITFPSGVTVTRFRHHYGSTTDTGGDTVGGIVIPVVTETANLTSLEIFDSVRGVAKVSATTNNSAGGAVTNVSVVEYTFEA